MPFSAWKLELRICEGRKGTPCVSVLPCRCFPEPLSSFLARDPTDEASPWLKYGLGCACRGAKGKWDRKSA